MSNLIGSLGLDQIEPDVNALPDGTYQGEVYKSEIVMKKDDTVHHVITYRVTDGSKTGVQRPEWFKLGDNGEKDASGTVVNMTPNMPEQSKPWYLTRLIALGIPQSQVNSFDPASLVGKKVNFGVKKNGAYINVTFAELREAPVVTDADGQPTAPTAGNNTVGDL